MPKFDITEKAFRETVELMCTCMTEQECDAQYSRLRGPTITDCPPHIGLEYVIAWAAQYNHWVAKAYQLRVTGKASLDKTLYTAKLIFNCEFLPEENPNE